MPHGLSRVRRIFFFLRTNLYRVFWGTTLSLISYNRVGFRRVLGICLVFCVGQVFARNYPGYEAGKKIGLEIIQRYPPEEYFYVGVGRSPTPVIAFLQEYLPAHSASNLPFGGVTADDHLWVFTQKDGRDHIDWEKGWGPNMDHHFKKFLPTPDQLGGRKILLVDYIVNGHSLSLAKRIVEVFLKKEGRLNGVKALGFHSDHINSQQINARGLDTLNIGFDQRFRYEKMDPWAEYPTWKIGETSPDTAQLLYSKLRAGFRESMKNEKPSVKSRMALYCNELVTRVSDSLKTPRPAY